MNLFLCIYLRPEIKFDSFPALIAQINKDIADCASICETATSANNTDYKKLYRLALSHLHDRQSVSEVASELIKINL